MSGTVMKFGPQWIRTLTDGAAPSTTATNNSSTISTTNSSNSSGLINSNHNSTSSSSLATSSNHNPGSGGSNNNSSLSYNNPTTSSLSSSNSNGALSSAAMVAAATASAGKYKLAEFRYGREEMLALFENGMEPPEDIKKFTELFVEKARMPITFTQMSDEEAKLSNRNWNSDAVIRSSSKIPPTAASGSGANPSVASGANVAAGSASAGLNSTMNDRDNRQLSERSTLTAAEVLSSSPRGPPGSLSRAPIEQRGLLSSLSSTRGHPSTIRNLVGRGTNLYTRSHDDEAISVEAVGAGGNPANAAFEGRFGQARQPNSLRTRFETSRATIASSQASGKPIEAKITTEAENALGGRSVFDRLPSKYIVDDKLIRKDINGRPLPSDWRSRDSKGLGEERPWRSTRSGGAGTAEDWRSGSNSGTNAATTPSWYVRSDDQRGPRSQGPQNQENLNAGFGGKRDTLRRPSADEKHGDEEDDCAPQPPRHRRDSLPEWSISDPLSGDRVGSFDASGAFREIARDENSASSNNNKDDRLQQQQQQHKEQQGDFEDLERAAEIMVDKWTADEEQHKRNSSTGLIRNKSNLTSREQHDAQANMLQNNTTSRLSNQAQQQQQQRHELQMQQQHQQHQQLQSAAEQSPAVGNVPSAFDSNNQQQKFILLPFNHEDSQQWFYRDTQGVIQGPFTATEMFDWYKAGYFVKELLVRRACDELFYPLGEVMKMWNRIPFAPIPMNMPPPAPITPQAISQFRAVTKQLEMAAGISAAASQGRIPPNAFDIAHPGTVLLHEQIIQQQQVHPVLAAASLNQNASAPPDQQANIRQIIEAATRQQQQHDPTLVQQQQQQPRALPVNVLDQNEMQNQLRQLLAQLKNREGFSNLNAQEQQEVLVRQFVASRSIPQGTAGLQEQAMLQQRDRMMPFLPTFFSNDQQQERIRYQQELERRQKEEAEKQNRLVMEQRMKAEEEKQRLMEEVQKQRQRKQNEEHEQRQKQEAEEERLLKLSQLKQQQLAKQQQEFRQQMQNQQRLQQQQQSDRKQQQQQQISSQQQQQQQVIRMSTIQQQQQQQIERAKKAAQAQQIQQEQQQQQQQQRKTAWSTVSKGDQEPVSLATLQKLQEEEKERERERQRQIQLQIQSNQQQQQQQLQLQRQMTWANAAVQSKNAPVKTLAEIQKEEEERLAREKQRKPKPQPVVASAGVWNNAASHLSWKNPTADS